MSIERPDFVPEDEVLPRIQSPEIKRDVKRSGLFGSIISFALNILVKTGTSRRETAKDHPLRLGLLDSLNESIGQTYEGYKYHEM